MVLAFAGLSTITSFLPGMAGHVSDALGYRGRAPWPSPVYILVAALSWPVLYGLFRLRARGRENLPEAAGTLAANHNSNLDPWPLGLPLFPGRYLRFMGSRSSSGRRSSSSPRPRGRFRSGAASGTRPRSRRRRKLCREGHVVVMFPEGTRKKGLRKRYEARAHTGAARIALRRGRPARPGRDRRHRSAAGSRSSGWRTVSGAARRPRRARGRCACGDRAADDCDRGARSLGVSELVLKQHNPVRPRPGFALFTLARGLQLKQHKPLLIVDGDSFAHRSYHALPKSIRRADGVRAASHRRREPARAALGGGAAAGGAGRLGHAHCPHYRHEALPSYQSAASSTTRCWSSSTSRRSSSRQWALHRRRLLDTKRTTSRRGSRFRGGARRAGARRERRPGHLPARQRVDDGSSAAARRRAADPDRPGRGARAVRRRARSGTGLHPLRGDPSDRIPARGVGAKTAADLLGRYDSPRRPSPRAGSPRRRTRCALSPHCDHGPRRPLPPLGDQQPTWSRAAALAEEWGLGRLAGRLEALSSS